MNEYHAPKSNIFCFKKSTIISKMSGSLSLHGVSCLGVPLVGYQKWMGVQVSMFTFQRRIGPPMDLCLKVSVGLKEVGVWVTQ